jgi:hypothetical protein
MRPKFMLGNRHNNDTEDRLLERIAEETHGPMCGCQYCREIAKLAPRLKTPGWIWQIGIPREQQTVSIAEVRATKKEELKAAKARHKAHIRREAIFAGRRVRTQRAA